jgi:hypothetical protein
MIAVTFTGCGEGKVFNGDRWPVLAAIVGLSAAGTPQSAGLARATVCAIVAEPAKFDRQANQDDMLAPP